MNEHIAFKLSTEEAEIKKNTSLSTHDLIVDIKGFS